MTRPAFSVVVWGDARPELARWSALRLGLPWELLTRADAADAWPAASEGRLVPVPGDPGEGVSAALGAVIVVLAPGLVLDELAIRRHLAHHASDGTGRAVGVGPVRWPVDRHPSALELLLADSDSPLGHRALRDGDRVSRGALDHASFTPALARAAGPPDARLDSHWARVEYARRLVRAGGEPSYLASAVARRSISVDPASAMRTLEAIGAGAAEALAVDPELVPEAALTWSRLAHAIGTDSRSARRGGLELLIRLLSASAPDPERYERFEERLLTETWYERAGGTGVAIEFHAALQLVRGRDRAGAHFELTRLAERLPWLAGRELARLLASAENFSAADEHAAALALRPELARHAAPHLLKGELALAAGALDRAEAAFARAYDALERPIDTAGEIARLYARYGPGPAARPHLERIAADGAGRSSRDWRTLVAPAIARLEVLDGRDARDRPEPEV